MKDFPFILSLPSIFEIISRITYHCEKENEELSNSFEFIDVAEFLKNNLLP
jgi:hypothetical protein